MNGRTETDLYAKLAEPWKPDNVAGFKVGDLADIQTLGRVEVVELLPPSLLKVRTKTGGMAKVGWMVCQRVRTKQTK